MQVTYLPSFKITVSSDVILRTLVERYNFVYPRRWRRHGPAWGRQVSPPTQPVESRQKKSNPNIQHEKNFNSDLKLCLP